MRFVCEEISKQVVEIELVCWLLTCAVFVPGIKDLLEVISIRVSPTNRTTNFFDLFKIDFSFKRILVVLFESYELSLCNRIRMLVMLSGDQLLPSLV